VLDVVEVCLDELPSSAGGGVAEGRGGVVKLSFTTDLVSNLQPTRGMKRRRECRLIVELGGACTEDVWR